MKNKLWYLIVMWGLIFGPELFAGKIFNPEQFLGPSSGSRPGLFFGENEEEKGPVVKVHSKIRDGV